MHVLCSVAFLFVCFFLKMMLLMTKHGRTRQATDDNIIQRIRISCCITKDTDTHSEYVPYFSIDNARVIYTKKV